MEWESPCGEGRVGLKEIIEGDKLMTLLDLYDKLVSNVLHSGAMIKNGNMEIKVFLSVNGIDNFLTIKDVVLDEYGELIIIVADGKGLEY